LYNGPDNKPAIPRYYKDTDNDFNTFEGTWKWEQGTSSWTIEFKKVVQYHRQHEKYNGIEFYDEYWDHLVGSYRYVENGVELINSLPITLGNDPYTYSMYGSTLTTDGRGFPPCPECVPDARHLIVYMEDPERPGLKGIIRMVRFNEGGVEKIRMKMIKSNSDPRIIGPDYTGPMTLTVPSGVYTFIKQ
jgi:hypothetical protein